MERVLQVFESFEEAEEADLEPWLALSGRERVRIPSTKLSTYRDAAVVCGKSERADDDSLAVTNPVVIVEVTSNSTEEYDRGEKLRH